VENLNKYQVNCRNVHVFFTAEFANENGEVAPWQSPYSKSGHFMRYFYKRLEKDLRMPLEQIHFWTKENTESYSDMIAAEGGADVIYTSLSWANGIGFIDAESFPAESMEELMKMGSRRVAVALETAAMESVRGAFGCSGDIGNVPPCAVTIGPKDIAAAKYTFHAQFLTACGGSPSYQRFPLRMALLGPADPKNPACIMRMYPGVCFAAPTVAASCIYVSDTPELTKKLSDIREKEEA